MMMKLVLFLLVAVGMVTSDESVVTLPDGEIKGIVQADARQFLGVPFAGHTDGANRWKEAPPPRPWSGVYDATKWRAGCPQDCDLPPETCSQSGTDENCLYVNVYTPRQSSDSGSVAVLVFFYGGNYIQGAASTDLYDGSFIANHTNVIVVVPNYRLGALSFLINDEGLEGNLATRDQITVLKWVQKNIGSFGGDKNRVTIFGQSAGGSSVAAIVTSPASEGLFNSAFMMSNPLALYAKTQPEMRELSERFAKDVGCGNANNMTCLREKSVHEILKAQKESEFFDPANPLSVFMPWQIYTTPGGLIPQQPMEALQQGTYHNKVPFITGNVESEAYLFIYEAFPEPVSPALYRTIVIYVFGLIGGNRVLNLYPVPANTTDARDILSTLGTDYLFVCPNRNISLSMAEENLHSVAWYRFDHVLSFNGWGPFQMCKDVCCHGADLPMFYQTAELGGFKYTPEELKLSTLMSTHLGNFATSGNPNQPVHVDTDFETFTPSKEQDIHYSTPKAFMETGYRTQYCNLFDQLGYQNGNGMAEAIRRFSNRQC